MNNLVKLRKQIGKTANTGVPQDQQPRPQNQLTQGCLNAVLIPRHVLKGLHFFPKHTASWNNSSAGIAALNYDLRILIFLLVWLFISMDRRGGKGMFFVVVGCLAYSASFSKHCWPRTQCPNQVQIHCDPFIFVRACVRVRWVGIKYS